MAADLFGNVTQTPAQLGGRRWYTLPLSILTHATVVTAIVVVPLANSELPPPIRRAIAQYSDTDITPVVPPPPPMRRASAPQPETPQVSPHAAPIEAPSGIAPESFADLVEAGDDAGVPNGIPGGLPTESTIVPPPPPPQPVEPLGPIRITRGVTPPRRIVYVQPEYPTIARMNRVTGRVVIEAIIGPSGDVESTRIVQSVKLLDQAALEAVRQWKYTPTLLSGVPVSVILTVSVDFTLAQ